MTENLGTGLKAAVFIHYEKSEPVARVKNFLRRHIVGAAVSVRAKLLQSLYAVILDGIGNGYTYTCVVLMVARAFEFYRSAV